MLVLFVMVQGERKIGEFGYWIENTFKRRVCTKFVPETSDRDGQRYL